MLPFLPYCCCCLKIREKCAQPLQAQGLFAAAGKGQTGPTDTNILLLVLPSGAGVAVVWLRTRTQSLCLWPRGWTRPHRGTAGYAGPDFVPGHGDRAQAPRHTMRHILYKGEDTTTPAWCWAALCGVDCLSLRAATACLSPCLLAALGIRLGKAGLSVLTLKPAIGPRPKKKSHTYMSRAEDAAPQKFTFRESYHESGARHVFRGSSLQELPSLKVAPKTFTLRAPEFSTRRKIPCP